MLGGFLGGRPCRPCGCCKGKLNCVRLSPGGSTRTKSAPLHVFPLSRINSMVRRVSPLLYFNSLPFPSLFCALKQGTSIDAARARLDPPAGLRSRDGGGLRSDGRGGGGGAAGRVRLPNEQVDLSADGCCCVVRCPRAVLSLCLGKLWRDIEKGLLLLCCLREGRPGWVWEMCEQRTGF